MKFVEEDLRVMLKGKYYDEKAKPKISSNVERRFINTFIFQVLCYI